MRVEQDILAKNDALAAHNRNHFASHRVLALNLVSSPGAGKTTLLVKTLEQLLPEATVAVIEGDQETSADADRIRATGALGNALAGRWASACCSSKMSATWSARPVSILGRPTKW